MIQPDLFADAAPASSFSWLTIYTRVRRSGERVSVALPPRRDAVLIRAGSRTIVLQHDELGRVADALRCAIEELAI